MLRGSLKPFQGSLSIQSAAIPKQVHQIYPHFLFSFFLPFPFPPSPYHGRLRRIGLGTLPIIKAIPSVKPASATLLERATARLSRLSLYSPFPPPLFFFKINQQTQRREKLEFAAI